MTQTISKNLSDDNDDTLMDITITSGAPDLAIKFQSWQVKALLIESLIIVIGFVSVVVYNWLFNAGISPLLGVLVGAINGSLVTWCIVQADRARQSVSNDG